MKRDLGAHFYKCDFQVHTLRDANWTGPFHPLTGRQDFAEALVADCRRKGIQAVAITDHHDLCLWRMVRDAAAAEINSVGQIYEPEERLIVFPGVELTLATPSCQALLIFDASLSAEVLQHIWGALRVTPTPETSAKTTQTLALHTDLTLDAITNSLVDIRINPDEINPLKFEKLAGKFILLPHLNKDGHKPIIRDGYHPHFSTMPCVGGYIEGCSYHELSIGNRNTIEGKSPQWGNKSLGVFQTSDCRKASNKTIDGQTVVDFETLGTWPTWVKWAEPSAEALRQACLARSSRISHHEPAYPLFQIIGVEVSESKFLGPVSLALNPQYNAFIGGRGTGKSSLLEYIRWALCDEPLPSDETIELPNFQRRRKALIDGTLRSFGGKVTVHYRRNGVNYRIERSVSEKTDIVTVHPPNGERQMMFQDQLRREFPIVSYAQKQLSCVGTLPDEINRLITEPVKEKLDQIQDQIEKSVLPELKEQRARELRLLSYDAQLRETLATIKGKREQIQALQSQLPSLTPEQQEVIKAHEILSQQEIWLNRSLDLPNRAAQLLEQLKDQIAALGPLTVPEHLPDREKVKSIAEDANAFIKRILEQFDAISTETRSVGWLRPPNKDELAALRTKLAAHQAAYAKAISDTARNQKQLDEIQSLNKQASDLENKQTAFETERSSLRAIYEKTGATPWNTFLTALKSRAELLGAQCEKINQQAQYEFKATLKFCGEQRPVREAVESLIQGRNVRDSDQKVKSLAAIVCSAPSPIEKWDEVMREFDTICLSRGLDILPQTPILTESGFSPANLSSLKHSLPQDLLESVRYMNLGDQIEFSFRMGTTPEGLPNYIPFDSASPGQQATCLLRTLLAESGAPLLIDQPEEDLDNEQIHVLSERIAETKHNRQLVFVSHNANIVVNGDAELVVCFGYENSTDNTKGKINPVGSIDCKPVREAITTVMEGGRRAFELRKKKYGF